MVTTKKEENDKDSIKEDKFLKSLLKGVRKIFILWIISKEKIHGYGLISKINDTSKINDITVIHGSSVYPILHSLEKEGLIISSEELNGNHKVKMYEITQEGKDTLNTIKSLTKSEKNNILTNFVQDMIL